MNLDTEQRRAGRADLLGIPPWELPITRRPRFPRAVRLRYTLMCLTPLLIVVPVALLAPHGRWVAGAAGVITWLAIAWVALRWRAKLIGRIVLHQDALCTRCMHPLEESEGRCPGCGRAYKLEEEIWDWYWFEMKW
jgi:hypothetical protein